MTAAILLCSIPGAGVTAICLWIAYEKDLEQPK